MNWFNRVAKRLEDAWLRNRAMIILGSLIVLFLAIFFFNRVFIFVDAGEVGVKFRRFGGGTEITRVYSEGIHVIFPWDSMDIYNIRIQECNQSVGLLSKNGLTLQFDLSIRFRPERDMAGVLHQRVGPDYVDKIVVPQIVSVLRVYVGRLTAEEVFTTQRAVLERVFTTAIEEVMQNYVEVEQVIISSIELPPAIQSAVEDKIEQKHIAEAYEYRLVKEQQEAKRLEIEAEARNTYNKKVAESLTPEILQWQGIEATRELATSPNGKIVVIGNGENDLPIILGAGASGQ